MNNSTSPQVPQDPSLLVLPALHEGLVEQFFVDHLKNINLLRQSELGQPVPDQEFDSNTAFWKSILQGQTRALRWINLKGFQVVDWYPRSPGLFHTDQAAWHREHADHYLHEEAGVRFYEPYGKVNMIQGGIGAIRFKTLPIEGEECWLCTATSDSYCHSGIPLAIPNRLMSHIGFDSQNRFYLTGQVRFLPEDLQNHFYHVERIPQIYVLIDQVQKINTRGLPVKITPMVFFTTDREEWRYQNGNVTYVTCYADNYTELDHAADWLNWYTRRYQGEVMTNFDQQRPVFQNAPFSLQKVMSGRLDVTKLETLHLDDRFMSVLLEGVRTINIGEIKMGDTFNMSGDFRGAILNIKSNLDGVSQSIGASSTLSPLTKNELKSLIAQLNDALQQTPPDKVEEAQAVADTAKSLVETATKESPNKTTLRINAEGLKLAAQNIAEVMPTVLTIATQIIGTVNQLV